MLLEDTWFGSNGLLIALIIYNIIIANLQNLPFISSESYNDDDGDGDGLFLSDANKDGLLYSFKTLINMITYIYIYIVYIKKESGCEVRWDAGVKNLQY